MSMSVDTLQGKRQRMIQPLDAALEILSRVPFEDLPDDLVLEILSRLPYQYVMCCKCVSKRWLSILSNIPHPFLKKIQPYAFIERSPGTLGELNVKLKFKDSVFPSKRLSLNFLPYYKERCCEEGCMNILQTFNDLLLCRPLHGEVCYVCNPLTMQCVELPCSAPFVNFICEYSHRELAEVGRVATCKFKVVQVHHPNIDNPFRRTIRIDIFSSESGQRTERIVGLLPNKLPKRMWIKETMTCNGNLFVIFGSDEVMVLNVNSLINSASARAGSCSHHHHYHLLELPKGVAQVCEGCLRVIQMDPVLCVWELREDYSNIQEGDECWSLVHQVSFSEMVIVNKSLPHDDYKIDQFRFLNFPPSDNNIMYFSLVGRVASYDMRNKALTFLPEETHPSNVPIYSTDLLPLVLPICPTEIP